MIRRTASMTLFALLLAVSGAAGSALLLQQESGALIMEGTLARVDAKNHLLWIKDSAGSEIEVTYTEQTEIVGASESASGLSSRSGSRLRIYYQVLGGVNLAIKIEVLPVQADGTSALSGSLAEVLAHG